MSMKEIKNEKQTNSRCRESIIRKEGNAESIFLGTWLLFFGTDSFNCVLWREEREKMKAIDKWGLLEFKQKAKTFYLESDDNDTKDIAKMKDAINYILVWLCELEDKNEKWFGSAPAVQK